jgi:predicted  nucleic acid-binding Zn-ribbon protein
MPVHPAAKGAQDKNNPYAEEDDALERAYEEMEDIELDVWDKRKEIEKLDRQLKKLYENQRGAYQRVLDLNGTLRSISQRIYALEDDMKEEAKEEGADPSYYNDLGVSFQRIAQRVQGK